MAPIVHKKQFFQCKIVQTLRKLLFITENIPNFWYYMFADIFRTLKLVKNGREDSGFNIVMPLGCRRLLSVWRNWDLGLTESHSLCQTIRRFIHECIMYWWSIRMDQLTQSDIGESWISTELELYRAHTCTCTCIPCILCICIHLHKDIERFCWLSHQASMRAFCWRSLPGQLCTHE